MSQQTLKLSSILVSIGAFMLLIAVLSVIAVRMAIDRASGPAQHGSTVIDMEAREPAGTLEAPGIVSDTAASDTLEVRRQDFADWLMACPEERAGPEHCVLVQNHVGGEPRRTMMMIQLRPTANGGVNAAFVTPNQVALRAGIALQVDEQDPIRIPFDHCANQQCEATARLEAGFVARLLGAEVARAGYETTGGQSIAVTISREGLADAIAALDDEAVN